MTYPFLDFPGPIPFAHRGGIDYPPNAGIENTLAAFANAVELGYRYLETDVHATRDGVVVIFHDNTLGRVTSQAGSIAELTYDELRTVRVGGVEPIPTMAEAFEAFPDVRFNIDVKVPEVIEPLHEVVRQAGAYDRICVSAFSGARLRTARRLFGPKVATALSPFEVLASRPPLPDVIARLLISDAPCIQVPVRSGPLRIVDRPFLDRAHARGKRVQVWTIDDAEEIDRLLDLGVDGIMSDRPDILRDVLISRHQWYA